jgi:hypothetical protein
LSTSGTSRAIIDLEDDGPSVVGEDRRRAMALLFTLSLAVGSAFLGRDAPLATNGLRASGVESAPTTTVYSRDGAQVVTAPANEYLSPAREHQ